MQIPIAVLLDKWGPRLVISGSAILCGLAVWMLVLVDSWPAALFSRLLYGACSVVGFLGTSKIISQWFIKKQYARMIGLTFSFGLLGALYGGRPLSLMMQQMGWEKVLLILGGLTLLLGVLIFLFVRNKVEDKKESRLSLWETFKKLVQYKSILILAAANFLMVGALEGFADVWGVPYLMAARNISKTDAASFTSLIFVGMLFGGPVLAYFSERYKAHYAVTMLCGVLMALLLANLFAFNADLPNVAIMIIMFVTGLLCCYQVLVFSIGHALVPVALMSLTIAFLNSINMFGGSFFHGTIGILMDFFEQGTVLNEVKSYSLETYTYALALIPLSSLVGSALVWWSRCKSISEIAANRAS